MASHVTKLHAEAAAAEHVLHTPLSTAPQGASQPSAASPMVSKKWRCTSPSCTHPQLRLSTCFHGHRELAPGCDSGRLKETATGTGLTRGTGPGHGGTTRSTSLISTVTDLRMLQHQPHTTARMLQHLHWCRRSRHRSWLCQWLSGGDCHLHRSRSRQWPWPWQDDTVDIAHLPRFPEAFSWMSRQPSGRKPPPAPASLAAMALVLAR